MKYVRVLTALVIALSVYTGVLAQAAFDVTRMDRSADACDDFFSFANGTWVKNTQIPASQPRWGSFTILSEANRDVLHDILEKASTSKAALGSDAQLIGDFYASCMDEAAIDKAETSAIGPTLADIDKLKNVDDVKAALAVLQKAGVGVLFRFGGGPDPKNSNMVIVNAGQGGRAVVAGRLGEKVIFDGHGG